MLLIDYKRSAWWHCATLPDGDRLHCVLRSLVPLLTLGQFGHPYVYAHALKFDMQGKFFAEQDHQSDFYMI